MPTPLITLYRVEKVMENGKSQNVGVLDSKEINNLME